MLTIYKYSGDPMFLHLQSFKIYSFGSELVNCLNPLRGHLQPHTTPPSVHMNSTGLTVAIPNPTGDSRRTNKMRRHALEQR